MTPRTIYVWGFPSTETFADWPGDLRPIRMQTLSGDRLVLVHSSALEDFQRAALHCEATTGVLPPAAVYLSATASLSTGSWVFYDARIRERDWQGLRDLLACPKQFLVEDAILDMSARVLADVRRRTQVTNPVELPLPETLRDHLLSCPVCRGTASDVLRQRLHARTLLLYPTQDRLHGLQRDPWLRVSLQHAASFAQRPVASFGSGSATALVTLGALLRCMFMANLFPAVAQSRRAAPGRQNNTSREEIVTDRLLSGQEVVLSRPHRDMRLAWDVDAQCLRIGFLHGDEQALVEDFAVALMQAGEPVWKINSQSGQVVLSMSVLQSALAQGAEELVIATLG